MRRWGTVTLMLFAFAIGFASTYNCGGGSSAEAAGDADTLQGHPAADFALASHSHPDLAPGVYPIGAPAFTPSFHGTLNLSGKGQYIYVGDTSVKAMAPVTLPFECTVTGVEAKIKKRNTSEDVVIELADATTDELDNLVPIASFDSSGWAASSSATVISTGAISHFYDPAAMENPWYIRVTFNEVGEDLRVYWVKLYYTIP